MSEELILRHCSPTLAGIKTANMFSCSFETEAEMRDSIRNWNKFFAKKGIRVIPLRFNNGRALVYIYRPAQLHRDLQHNTASRILKERGYGTDRIEHCVSQLRKRLGESEEFPHEIGLFLGYPPEDVCGFIENGAKECKCVGCWKVYGDVISAQKTFARYKKCTDVYCELHSKGRPIERLTVAI